MLTHNQIQTPFGEIRMLFVVAPGIVRFYAGEGTVMTEGMALTQELNLKVPLVARNPEGFYGGKDMPIAEIVFSAALTATMSQEFGPSRIARAEDHLKRDQPDLYEALMLHKPHFPNPSNDDGPDLEF